MATKRRVISVKRCYDDIAQLAKSLAMAMYTAKPNDPNSKVFNQWLTDIDAVATVLYNMDCRVTTIGKLFRQACTSGNTDKLQ